MLLRAYAVNVAVSAVGYYALWSYAPSWPQLMGSFEQGVHAYAQDHAFLGPVFYRVIAPR